MKITIIILLLTVSTAIAYPRIILEDGYNQRQEEPVSSNAQASDFESAWQNYKFAFAPLYDAVMQNDLKAAISFVDHVKEASIVLSKNEMPDRYDKGARKLRKDILKLSKTLVKNAKERDREGLKQTVSHIKDRMDRLDDARNNNGKSNYDG